MKNKAEKKLAAHGQSHLLKYADELNDADRQRLFEQICDLDFSVLSENGAETERGAFKPISVTKISEIEANRSRYEETGLEAIRAGKVGAVLLAGGQGSRLGFDKPKGMFNIGVHRKLYIFECIINNLLEVVHNANSWVPLFIMTSRQNDAETRQFLEEHSYFGYRKESVAFFVQEQLPTVDINGKLMLADKGVVSAAPNGNGGWYTSMMRSGVMKSDEAAKVEWINVFAVDNVLQRIADPCFVGAVIDSGKNSGAKVVAKADPEEKVGVMCLENGRPSIVEYYEMTREMIESREADGTLSYNYGVILNYLFNLKSLNKTLDVKFPLHKAFKKINYLDDNGKVVSPEEPNAYKFETLVLDMVKLQNSCLAYEVDRNNEFAPVKNKTGVDSIDTARELLRRSGTEL